MIGGDDATVAKLVDERDRWVVKARFGCGGSAVVVGAKPSWPTQRLPRVVDQDGAHVIERVALSVLARDAGVALDLDHEGRITMASWERLWPRLMRFVAGSPGHYVAQQRVEPAPFHAMVYDGRRIEAFEATADFAAAFTLGWRGEEPRLSAAGTLCRAVPLGHPHTNITTRGALVPVMTEDEFDRLFVALGLHRERASAPAALPLPRETVAA